MKTSKKSIRGKNLHHDSFEDRVAILFEELELAIKWQRPSILLAIYGSEFVRADAESALESRLLGLGQKIHRLKVKEEHFDIPKVILRFPGKDKTIIFITGLRWGGGKNGHNAYRALNMRREYFVDNQIRAVFWLTESEAIDLPLRAPDFWAFRHRVIEFLQPPDPKSVVSRTGGLTRCDCEPFELGEDIDAKIALREAMLADLPDKKESQSTRADLLYALSCLYRAKGELKKSINLLKKGLGIAEKLQYADIKSQFWVGLGFVYQDMERLEEAISAYRTASKLNPKDSRPWNSLGSIYQNLGQNREAINACKKAIKLDPKDAKPWNNLGNIYRDLGRIEDSTNAFKIAIKLDPKDGRTWNNLGNIYHDQGRTTEAINAYKKAIKLYPKNTGFLNNLGSVYTDLGRFKEAISTYKRAIKLDPKDSRHWYNLGYIYRILNSIPDAIKAYKKANELDPRDASILISLAGCFRLTGNKNKVAEYIKYARPLMKKESEYNRASFEAIRGNVNKAIELAKTALEKKLVSLDRVHRDPNFDFIRDDPRFQVLLGKE